MTVSAKKILTFALLGSISALIAYFGQPFIHGNDKAVNIVVTVFTVFAGFLIAIITVLGDPSNMLPGDWKIAENERSRIDRRLIRHTWLFAAYLITIALIFMSSLVEKMAFPWVPDVLVWIERTYLWTGVFAFTLSMFLPKMLLDLQRERVDHEIENRRNDAGLSD